RIKKESEKMGLHLNIKKTKIMTTAGNGAVKITINNEEIECVKVFCFLGSMIDRTENCGPEIRRQIALGRSAMLSMHQIWKSKDISLTTKCKMVHATVLPISMYGCESWTLKKADRKRMDAFKIPWTARVTNKEVLERIKPEILLEGKITKLWLTYFGHVMRSDSLEKAMMLGIVSGTKRQGRQRTRWLDAIKTDTGLGIEQLKE
uniref:Reverse transcriptase domain-containing protein n=1 Tax=Lepisosteus oculatus TaxID=7918 RepID=W5MUQ0_LEPOC